MEIINKILWTIAISLILVNSIYFTIKLKGPQFKFISLLKSLKIKKTNNISPLDTLIMTLSSKIGVGSLGGIALAIAYGGLGTIFWIWVSAFFLSIITYIENTLAIIYKEKDGKYTKSGPSYYIKKGLQNKALSTIYALIIIITYTILFTSIQNNTITTLTTEIYGLDKILIALIVTILTSIAIIKGIKTISNICNKVFPLMMIIFLTIGLIVLITNLNQIPTLLNTIINEALSKNAISGGIIYTILLAIQKTIFANESGTGTSAIISGTTENNDCKLQGNMGIIQVYFINFIVLTTTALIIGTTKYQNINIINGIELTKYAFSYHLGSFGEIMLLIIIFLFSFSTLITIYYYGENCLKFLTKKKMPIKILKIVTITSIFIGGIIKANIIWLLIDIALAILTIINMYAIYKLKDKIIKKHDIM
ncbi:MAG: amino acid carrier protein [bacterium]|nr:amino acid carrier protein [bacterium]